MKANDEWRKRPGESYLQMRARIARDADLNAGKDAPIVNQFAEQHGHYIDDFILHNESSTKARVKINRGGSSIDRWLLTAAFEEGEQKAIRHCQGLWAILDGYSRPMFVVDGGEGRREHEALTELAGYKRKIPVKYWSVFENVARQHIDAERAGMGLASNNRSARDAAKTATAFCAGLVAMWNGY